MSPSLTVFVEKSSSNDQISMSGLNNRELRKQTSFVIGTSGKSQDTQRMVSDTHQITGAPTSQVCLILPSH
jgi:hypothetical protein